MLDEIMMSIMTHDTMTMVMEGDMIVMVTISFLFILFRKYQMSEIRFEEKILYKTHQHWIVAISHSLKLLLLGVLPLTVILYILVDYSFAYTMV